MRKETLDNLLTKYDDNEAMLLFIEQFQDCDEQEIYEWARLRDVSEPLKFAERLVDAEWRNKASSIWLDALKNQKEGELIEWQISMK